MRDEGMLAVTGNALDGPRPARSDELDALIAMLNHVFRTSVGREPTVASDWAHVFAPDNLANIMVVSDGGKPVASTGVWACDVVMGDGQLRVGGINLVGTLPEYRRFGLGSQVMAAAHQTMRRLGCQVGLLSTGITNWYRRMGWEEAGSVRSYRLNRGNIATLPLLPAATTVRTVHLGSPVQGDADVVAAIVALHARQRMGATRTVERFRQLAMARQVEHVVLAENEGGPVAYLLLHDHAVVEWAGEARVVAGLVRATFEASDDPTASTSTRAHDGGSVSLRAMTLRAPGFPHPLVELLDEVRLPYHTDYLGMLYLVDPQAILDAYGLTSVQLRAEGSEFVLRDSGGSGVGVRFDQRQLTKLFFGPERVSNFAADRFPLPFWQWGLEKV